MNEPILGILGGLGPMSGVYFCELLTAHTKAERDQDHVHFLLSSRASTPDRTAHILDKGAQSPLPVMAQEAQRLERAGASVLAIPCNTAHYFYNGIAQSVAIPVLNIIEQNAAYCRHLGLTKVGVLATEGTVRSGAYRDALASLGIAYVTCTDEEQAALSDLIYGQIKRGRAPHGALLSRLTESLYDKGCQRIILGCTELSLLCRTDTRDTRLIDSMEVLAAISLAHCGKDITDLDPSLIDFAKTQSTKRKESYHAAL